MSINIICCTFIYDGHYKLALGEFGMWLFGIVAVIWTLDCFVGFYLTLPARRKISQLDRNDLKYRTFRSRWAVAWKMSNTQVDRMGLCIL